MEFTDDEVVIDKEPSELDELVIDIVRILDDTGIDYAVVSGYVAAYKLGMDTPKDFEDALYLSEVVGRNLNTSRLEEYVERLGVEDAYERLERP